jgi:hypothetical protein
MERDRRNETAGRGMQMLELASVIFAMLMLLLLVLSQLNSGHGVNVSVPQKVNIQQLPSWH